MSSLGLRPRAQSISRQAAPAENLGRRSLTAPMFGVARVAPIRGVAEALRLGCFCYCPFRRPVSAHIRLADISFHFLRKTSASRWLHLTARVPHWWQFGGKSGCGLAIGSS
jgi:hypothetical protein